MRRRGHPSRPASTWLTVWVPAKDRHGLPHLDPMRVPEGTLGLTTSTVLPSPARPREYR